MDSVVIYINWCAVCVCVASSSEAHTVHVCVQWGINNIISKLSKRCAKMYEIKLADHKKCHLHENCCEYQAVVLVSTGYARNHCY